MGSKYPKNKLLYFENNFTAGFLGDFYLNEFAEVHSLDYRSVSHKNKVHTPGNAEFLTR